jgi:hypothetical protein
MARKTKLNWAVLCKRIPINWRPDPHKRGRADRQQEALPEEAPDPAPGFSFCRCRLLILPCTRRASRAITRARDSSANSKETPCEH